MPERSPKVHRRRWVVMAVLVGLALRLGFSLLYWTDKPLTLDEQEYLLLARSLVSGQGFSYPVVSDEGAPATHFERPPAYPAFLAALLVMTGHRWVEPVHLPRSSSEIPREVTIAQALLGALAVWLVALLAARVAGPGAGVAGAALAAFYPPLVWTCAYMLNETLYSVLALATAWLLVAASDPRARKPMRLGLLAGLVAGVAVLTKEAMVFFFPLAGLYLLMRRRPGLLAALVLGTAVVLLPWVARNYVVHDRFVLTAAHGGVTFWTGNNPLARGEGDLAANPEMKRARIALEAQHAGMSNQEMDAVYYREAVDFIVARPLAWSALLAKKLFYTVVPVGPSYRLHSARYFLGSVLSYGLLIPFAIVGFVRLGPRRSALWPLWLLGASVVVVCVVFFPQERFRIPVIDPLLIICAAACAAPRPLGRALTAHAAPVVP
jgi:4-amino-4-deoxy-L-arabinose transferase-like glycosyltransferase